MLLVVVVEIWLVKSDFESRLFIIGFFLVLLFVAWVDFEVDEWLFEFDVFFLEVLFVWLVIKVLFIDGCVRCFVILYWRLIIYFNYWKFEKKEISYFYVDRKG